MSSPWRTHSSRTVYENPWLVVREDDVTRPDGARGVYGVAQVRHPAVFVVPVTGGASGAEQVVLVRLFRYPIGRWSLEVPAGGAEEADLLVAAQRELREEAGLEAATWTDLGEVHSLNGLADAPGRVYLARDLVEVGGADRDQREEGISDVRRVAWSDLPDLARRGELTDDETLAALQLARWELDRPPL